MESKFFFFLHALKRPCYKAHDSKSPIPRDRSTKLPEQPAGSPQGNRDPSLLGPNRALGQLAVAPLSDQLVQPSAYQVQYGSQIYNKTVNIK